MYWLHTEVLVSTRFTPPRAGVRSVETEPWCVTDMYHGNELIRVLITRNELASLAHSFYTSLKHQFMHALVVLLSSTLGYVACMMLDPQL